MKTCKNTECANKVDDDRVYCSLSCRNIFVNKNIRDYKKNGQSLSGEKQYYTNPKKCIFCDSIIEYSHRRNKFCSSKCSASTGRLGRTHSLKTKNKIRKSTSIAITKKWQDPEYAKKSLVSVGKRRFNSQGEIEVRNYFINKFPNHEWTYGGFINIGTHHMISADMYSVKLKICIEYDGIWHFKNINGQLEKKQKKDQALNEWCANNGYRIIRISEDYYKKNKIVSLQELENEVLFGNSKLTKFYC